MPTFFLQLAQDYLCKELKKYSPGIYDRKGFQKLKTPIVTSLRSALVKPIETHDDNYALRDKKLTNSELASTLISLITAKRKEMMIAIIKKQSEGHEDIIQHDIEALNDFDEHTHLQKVDEGSLGTIMVSMCYVVRCISKICSKLNISDEEYLDDQPLAVLQMKMAEYLLEKELHTPGYLEQLFNDSDLQTSKELKILQELPSLVEKIAQLDMDDQNYRFQCLEHVQASIETLENANIAACKKANTGASLPFTFGYIPLGNLVVNSNYQGGLLEEKLTEAREALTALQITPVASAGLDNK